MTIYDRMKAGEWIDIRTDQGYKTEAAAELQRSRKICFQFNHTELEDPRERSYLDDLFEGRLPESSNLFSPIMIDRAKAMTIGENVFINHGLTVMSSGSVTIEDNVMIGPEAILVTANHDVTDLRRLQFKPITIKKGAWLGARVVVLPGVTVGEGAVVGSGAVVTKDVPDRTIVGGNPAKVIRRIGESE